MESFTLGVVKAFFAVLLDLSVCVFGFGVSVFASVALMRIEGREGEEAPSLGCTDGRGFWVR